MFSCKKKIKKRCMKMYMFAFPEMLWNHVTDEKIQAEHFDNAHKLVFEALLVGVNISNLEAINDIAVYLSGVSDEEIKTLTYEDVVKNVGCFVDNSGYLV